MSPRSEIPPDFRRPHEATSWLLNNCCRACRGPCWRADQGEGGKRSRHRSHIRAELLQASADLYFGRHRHRHQLQGARSSTPQRTRLFEFDQAAPTSANRPGRVAWSSPIRCVGQDNIWVVDEGTNTVIVQPRGVIMIGRRRAGAGRSTALLPAPAEAHALTAHRRHVDAETSSSRTDTSTRVSSVTRTAGSQIIGGSGSGRPAQYAAFDHVGRPGQHLRRRSRQRVQVFDTT